MICSACNDDIAQDEVRWDGDIPYCEQCFDDRYNFCSRCDATIPRDETNYDDGGNLYCNSCWEQDFDDDAPNNPCVTESDREYIIQLSRSWLQGKIEY